MNRSNTAMVNTILALLTVAPFFVPSAAAAGEFRSESEKTVWTGEQDATEGAQKQKAAGSTLTCTEVRGEATTTTKSNTAVTIKPLKTTNGSGFGFGGCTFFGVPVTLNVRTCDYVIYNSGLLDIAGCSGTEPYMSFKATVLGSSCEVRTGNQTGLSKVTYTGIGSGTTSEITADVNISGIKYDAIGSLCTQAGLGQTNGLYDGKLTITGEVDGTTTHTGVSFS